MTSLTPKQKKMLDYLTEFIGEHGHSPTTKQIAKRFRLRSPSTVHKHLTSLRDKGFIERRENTPRGVSLTASALDVPSPLVPIKGDVAPDGTLRENADGPSMIHVPPALAENEQAFALRITGDPLPGSTLQDGDFLIAHDAGGETGHELVVAEMDGRTRLRQRPTRADREARTDGASPERRTVRAVVTGMLRTYASARTSRS